jgi:hypothetical protein
MQDLPKKNRLLEFLPSTKKNPTDGEFRVALKDAQNEAWETYTLFEKKKITIIEIIAELVFYKELAQFRLERNVDLKRVLKEEIKSRLKPAIMAGFASGKSRAENANKSKVVEAWHAWQNHPTKQPYGTKRGCESAFEEAMIKQYDVSPISVKAWRIKLKKTAKLVHERGS